MKISNCTIAIDDADTWKLIDCFGTLLLCLGLDTQEIDDTLESVRRDIFCRDCGDDKDSCDCDAASYGRYIREYDDGAEYD